MASGEIQSSIPIISNAYTISTIGTEITFLAPSTGLYLIYALVTNASHASFWLAYLNLKSVGYNYVSLIWSASNAAITIDITGPGKLTIKTTESFVNLLIISFATYVLVR